MTWFTIALLSSAVSGLVNIFDKTVLHTYARTPRTLPLMIGIAQTVGGSLIILAVGIPTVATSESIAWSLVSGALFGLGAQFLMRVLYQNEVSRTVPVFQTSPIFTALLAAIFLGERITGLQWGAVLLTVAGAMLLSIRIDGGFRQALMHRSIIALLIGAFIGGSAHVAGKAAVDVQPVLFTHGLRMLALGLVFLGFNLRTSAFNDVKRFVRERSPGLAIVTANELVIANLGLVLMLWALQLGPASLVTAVTATRAFFVVLYSTILAMIFKGFLGEITTPQTVVMKVAATSMIVLGVAAMAIL